MIAEDHLTAEHIQRRDREVLADVAATLRDANDLRSVEAQDLDVSAEAGLVLLRGHVGSNAIKREVQRLTAAVAGVQAVNNALVVDPELMAAVARALATDVSTRASVFRVGASSGWIQLGGEAPDARVRDVAQVVAAGVPAVRGVIGLPRLAGGAPSQSRRALQPRPGSAAYASDGELGEVRGVIIDPRHRLVTHVIVHARLNPQWLEEGARGQFVIPVDVVSMSTVGGTMLTESMAAVSARPRFRDADYAWTPIDWQLPFPYRLGEVHWPAQYREPTP